MYLQSRAIHTRRGDYRSAVKLQSERYHNHPVGVDPAAPSTGSHGKHSEQAGNMRHRVRHPTGPDGTLTVLAACRGTETSLRTVCAGWETSCSGRYSPISSATVPHCASSDFSVNPAGENTASVRRSVKPLWYALDRKRRDIILKIYLATIRKAAISANLVYFL